MRWWLVVAIPGSQVRIVPRSASRPSPIAVPKEAMPEFTKDGWMQNVGRTIQLFDAEQARNIGRLPEPYLQDTRDWLAPKSRRSGL